MRNIQQKAHPMDTQEARHYAESIVDTVREPLIMLDKDLKVVSASRSFYETFKVNEAETENRYLFDLGNGQWNIQSLRRLLTEILPQKKVMEEYEVEHVFPSIGRKLMLLNARRIDHYEIMLLAIEDITDRKNAENLMKDESRRKNEFLASLAHELRNPLGAIKGGVELLSRAITQPDRMAQICDMVQRQLWHVLRLIDGLSDISSITEGKVKLHMEPLDLSTVAKDSIEAARPVMEEKKQEFVLQKPPDAIRVMGDSTRLNQIIFNLLHNASKYTPEGGKITLAIRKENNEARISVHDNGIGIAKEKQPRIFDLYMQVAPATQGYGGLGIGLALVKKLADMHHGSVEVYSDGDGKGSEFTVRLPAL